MRDRLQKFMQSENISAGKLAEMIGVQPSAISHIMSGRNKPGFDFLAGLFYKFPNLNPRWMIIGEGSMELSPGHYFHEKKTLPSPEIDISTDLFSGTAPYIETESVKTTPIGNIRERSVIRSKSIERIVIFYTDGTFSPYEQQ